MELIGSGASGYSDILFYNTNKVARLGYIDWSDTQARWNVEANIPLILYTNSTERMRITSGGITTIAASSNTSDLGSTGLVIGGSSTLTSGNVLMLNFIPIGHTSNRARAGIGCLVGADWGKGNLTFYTQDASSGAAMTTANERMRITSDGNVLIGKTTDDGQRLQVNGAVRTDNVGLIRASSFRGGLYTYDAVIGSGTDYGMTIFAEGGTGNGNIYLCPGGSVTKRMTIASSGNVIFSSQVYNNTPASPRTLYIASDGEIGGQSSIRASKTNIEQLDSNWLMELNPVSFNYRKKDGDGNYTDEHYEELFYGLIAEEAELVNKEICTYNEDKLIGIEYSKLVPVLVKAIQEQQAQIEELKAKLA
jgi:hypothetical protein